MSLSYCLGPGKGGRITDPQKDLLAFGNRVIIYPRACKFYYVEPEYPIKVFSENFTDHFVSFKGFISCAEKLLLTTVIETGAKRSERLSVKMSFPVSVTTLLRWFEMQPMPVLIVPTGLGIED